MHIFKNIIPRPIIILTIFSVILIILRVIIWQKYSFVYILLNILLAFIPFFISYFLLFYFRKEKESVNNIVIIIGGLLWLLFIPNSIYIITDFVHLGVVRAVPIIYDAILLFSSALLGLILGLMSISHIEQIIRMKFSKRITFIFIGIIIFLIGFGVYLGRFWRFNSWDIFSQPLTLFNSLGEIFRNSTNLVESLLYSTLFFIFIIIFYILSKMVQIK